MAALAGNYVNFGVFELYGDRALADALDIALKMTLSVPLADILAYRKVCCISVATCTAIFCYGSIFLVLDRLVVLTLYFIVHVIYLYAMDYSSLYMVLE